MLVRLSIATEVTESINLVRSSLKIHILKIYFPSVKISLLKTETGSNWSHVTYIIQDGGL